MTDQEYVMRYICITPGRPTPESRQELFVIKWEYRIKQWIRRYSFDQDEVDDIYQHIMQTWFEKDMISKYDSTVGADFSTFVLSYVKKHIRYWQLKRKRKSNTWMPIDDIEIMITGPEPTTNFDPVVHYLKRIPKKGTQDLYALFLSILNQIVNYGNKDITRLAQDRGIKIRSIQYQIERLREALIGGGFVQFDGAGSPVWSHNLV